MNILMPGISNSNVQNTYAPLVAGGKVGGNVPQTQNGSSDSFGDAFSNALQELNALEAVKSADSYNLSLGNIDDLGTMMTNAERSQVAFQMFVQLRNKALDAYSEIMRMNL